MIAQIAKFLFSSIVVQGISSINGLLLANLMSVEEYAFFTISMMITGAMTVLTKGGVHLGFTTIVGRTWPDRNRATQAVKAAIEVRKMISVFILPPVLGIATWLLWKNHANNIVIIGLLVLLVINWQFDMKTRVVEQILMFANQASKTQALEATLALSRLFGSLALYYLNCLNALGAIAMGVIIAGIRMPFIQSWVNIQLVKGHVSDAHNDQKEIRKITYRQLPIEIFYVLQTQAVFSILALHSATEQTASIGALWRIGQLLVPFQAVLHAFAIPRFSQTKTHIFRSLMLWSFPSILLGLSLVIISYFFPDLLLLLIGPHYSNLQYELFVASIGIALNSAIGVSLQLIAHHGWNYFAWTQIPIVLIWCAVAPFFLNLSNLDQILWFNAGLNSGAFCAIFIELIAAKNRGDLK